MATIGTYDIGDLVRLTGTLETADGTNVDPTTVICKILPPSGTSVTYTYGADAFPVKSAVGVYYVDYTPTEAGDFWYRFTSTGTGQATDENRFYVSARQVA